MKTKRTTVWADPVVVRWPLRWFKIWQSLTAFAGPMDMGVRHTALLSMFLVKLIGPFRIRLTLRARPTVFTVV